MAVLRLLLLRYGEAEYGGQNVDVTAAYSLQRYVRARKSLSTISYIPHPTSMSIFEWGPLPILGEETVHALLFRGRSTRDYSYNQKDSIVLIHICSVLQQAVVGFHFRIDM